jgi:hypothetical protein
VWGGGKKEKYFLFTTQEMGAKTQKEWSPTLSFTVESWGKSKIMGLGG